MLKLKPVSVAVVLLWAALTDSIKAQSSWAPAGFTVYHQVGPVQQVYANDDHDEIYYVGWFQLDTGAYWQFRNPVMRYSQGQWDTLGYFSGFIVHTVVVYHDTLIAAGTFHETIDGAPCEYIAYWANGDWHAYGEIDSPPRKLRVLDDTLYAVGSFAQADGQPVKSIARREGGHWVAVGQPPVGEMNWVDVIKYQGRLITIGYGYIDDLFGVFRLVDGEWSVLGPGFSGGVSGAQCLAVYHEDLYLGGQILLQEGNVGQAIMRWDGSSFHSVGAGLQANFNDFYSISAAATMAVHNDLLWVGGGFRYASGVEARGVATWDGTKWCGVPGDMGRTPGAFPEVYSMEFYHDTLFVACRDSADGQYMNRGAKFIGASYVDTCGAPLGLADDLVRIDKLRVWQTAIGELSIHGLAPGMRSIALFDAAGRSVIEQFVRVDGSTPVNLRIPILASGVYSLKSGTTTARCVIAGP